MDEKGAEWEGETGTGSDVGPWNLSGVKRKHFTESQRTALQFKLSASFVMQNVHRGETGGRQEDTAVVTG